MTHPLFGCLFLDVLFCSIEEALDTLLRSLLKLFVVDANLADLAVGRNHGVELLTVLLHNLLQLFSTQVQRLRFVEIWINQTDELVALLNHYAFADER